MRSKKARNNINSRTSRLFSINQLLVRLRSKTFKLGKSSPLKMVNLRLCLKCIGLACSLIVLGVLVHEQVSLRRDVQRLRRMTDSELRVDLQQQGQPAKARQAQFRGGASSALSEVALQPIVRPNAISAEPIPQIPSLALAKTQTATPVRQLRLSQVLKNSPPPGRLLILDTTSRDARDERMARAILDVADDRLRIGYYVSRALWRYPRPDVASTITDAELKTILKQPTQVVRASRSQSKTNHLTSLPVTQLDPTMLTNRSALESILGIPWMPAQQSRK